MTDYNMKRCPFKNISCQKSLCMAWVEQENCCQHFDECDNVDGPHCGVECVDYMAKLFSPGGCGLIIAGARKI
jgi:hypothetical protein